MAARRSTSGFDTLYTLGVLGLVLAVGWWAVSGAITWVTAQLDDPPPARPPVTTFDSVQWFEDQLVSTTVAPRIPGGDIDCWQVAGPVWVGDYDPNGLDGDGDGWGCE